MWQIPRDCWYNHQPACTPHEQFSLVLFIPLLHSPLTHCVLSKPGSPSRHSDLQSNHILLYTAYDQIIPEIQKIKRKGLQGTGYNLSTQRRGLRTVSRNQNGKCFPFGAMATEQRTIIAWSSSHLRDSLHVGWLAFEDWTFNYLSVFGKHNRSGGWGGGGEKRKGEKKKNNKDKRRCLQKTLSSLNKKEVSWAEKKDRASLQLKKSKEQARKCNNHEQADCFTWKHAGARVVPLSKAAEHRALFYIFSGNRQGWETEVIPSCKLIIQKVCMLHC